MHHLFGMTARTFTFVVIILAVGFNSAGAQGMRMSPQERANVLRDSLALDSSQTAKVAVIYKESQNAVMDAMQSSTGDRETMRATIQDISKKSDDKIKALLNDPQKKKFEAMIKNRPVRGQRMRGN